MSAPLSPTPNDVAAAAAAAAAAATGAPAPGTTAPAPTAQAAPLQPAAPQDPAPGQTTAPDAGGDNGGESKLTHEQALAELAKVRQEAARYRTRVRELEPLEKAAQEAADKEKSEIQRAQEAAQQAQAELAAARLDAERFALAAKHSIPETHLQLITGDTPEARAASAALVGDLLAQATTTAAPTAPPSDRPLEGLRPGASPTPPAQADHSYPAAWLPQSRATS